MNSGVAVEALALTLGAFRLKRLDFSVARGEILVILGPNGSGKSVTLETIAGFHRPDGGRVLIHGRDVTRLPPERRHVAFVVQSFGLFPHLSVMQNVAIARRADRAAVAADTSGPPQGDVAALLAYFGIAQLAERAPNRLSPGEKQRVALARALAGAPDLFLFDEPFSALDAQTTGELREELLSFLRALAIPAIFVTHDHTDALALADNILVLRDGAVVQSGPAVEIFRKPASAFVARFIGVENVIDARVIEVRGPFAIVAAGGRALRTTAPISDATPKSVRLSIRAEDVTVGLPGGDAPGSCAVNRLEGRVTGLRPLGALVTVQIDCGFALKGYLLAPQARAMNIAVDSPVIVAIPAEAIHVMKD